MKINLLSLITPVAFGTTSLVAISLSVMPAMAQQNCWLESRPHTENWFDGEQWRTSTTFVSERVCRGESSSAPASSNVSAPVSEPEAVPEFCSTPIERKPAPEGSPVPFTIDMSFSELIGRIVDCNPQLVP